MKYKIIIVSLFLLFFVTTLMVVLLNNRNINKEHNHTKSLVIYTPHPISFLSPMIEEFESQTGILVSVVSGGSGELIDRIEEEGENPKADILWGGSLSTLIPQLYLFDSYYSQNEEQIQDEFKNEDGYLTRFSDVPSILMVNTDLSGDIQIDGYEDLLNPELKGKIAFANPSISSSSYEHLINMLYAMGEGIPEMGWDYVNQLCENLDGNLLNGSTAVYEGVLKGEFVVGLTFEEAAAAMVADGKHIKIVYMKEGVISTPDCISLIKNAKNKDNAKQFIDFVTSYEAQTILTSKLNRRSVRVDVNVPKYLLEKDEFTIINSDKDLVYIKKKEWLQQFKEIFTTANED